MTQKPPQARAPFGRTFGAPMLIALASTVGLVAALLGDGLKDWTSWIGLGVPLAVITWAWLRRRA